MSCAEIDIGICPRRDRRVRLETRGKRSYGCGARTTVSRARKLAPQRIGHYAHEGATVTGPGAIGRRGRGGSQHLPILEIAKITLSSVPVGGNGLLALIATAGYLPLHMRHVVYTLRGSCPGTAETSQEHSLSSGNRVGCREGLVFGIGLPGLEAVVEAAEEAVEQVALRGGVSIAGHAAPVG